jgi:hypothetical protein
MGAHDGDGTYAITIENLNKLFESLRELKAGKYNVVYYTITQQRMGLNTKLVRAIRVRFPDIEFKFHRDQMRWCFTRSKPEQVVLRVP